MKLFKQLLVTFLMLCFGNAFAQQVIYQVSIPPEKIDLAAITPLNFSKMSERVIGQMVFNYKPNGYEATMNGNMATFEITNNLAVITMQKLVIMMPFDGDYWHNRVGQWRTVPITTSFGDKGVAKMFYAGLTPRGRLYREEMWLNGRIFIHGDTVIDHNDQIVWSICTDSEGTLRLTRM